MSENTGTPPILATMETTLVPHPGFGNVSLEDAGIPLAIQDEEMSLERNSGVDRFPEQESCPELRKLLNVAKMMNPKKGVKNKGKTPLSRFQEEDGVENTFKAKDMKMSLNHGLDVDIYTDREDHSVGSASSLEDGKLETDGDCIPRDDKSISVTIEPNKKTSVGGTRDMTRSKEHSLINSQANTNDHEHNSEPFEDQDIDIKGTPAISLGDIMEVKEKDASSGGDGDQQEPNDLSSSPEGNRTSKSSIEEQYFVDCSKVIELESDTNSSSNDSEPNMKPLKVQDLDIKGTPAMSLGDIMEVKEKYASSSCTLDGDQQEPKDLSYSPEGNKPSKSSIEKQDLIDCSKEIELESDTNSSSNDHQPNFKPLKDQDLGTKGTPDMSFGIIVNVKEIDNPSDGGLLDDEQEPNSLNSSPNSNTSKSIIEEQDFADCPKVIELESVTKGSLNDPEPNIKPFKDQDLGIKGTPDMSLGIIVNVKEIDIPFDGGLLEPQRNGRGDQDPTHFPEGLDLEINQPNTTDTEDNAFNNQERRETGDEEFGSSKLKTNVVREADNPSKAAQKLHVFHSSGTGLSHKNAPVNSHDTSCLDITALNNNDNGNLGHDTTNTVNKASTNQQGHESPDQDPTTFPEASSSIPITTFASEDNVSSSSTKDFDTFPSSGRGRNYYSAGEARPKDSQLKAHNTLQENKAVIELGICEIEDHQTSSKSITASRVDETQVVGIHPSTAKGREKPNKMKANMASKRFKRRRFNDASKQSKLKEQRKRVKKDMFKNITESLKSGMEWLTVWVRLIMCWLLPPIDANYRKRPSLWKILKLKAGGRTLNSGDGGNATRKIQTYSGGSGYFGLCFAALLMSNQFSHVKAASLRSPAHAQPTWIQWRFCNISSSMKSQILTVKNVESFQSCSFNLSESPFHFCPDIGAFIFLNDLCLEMVTNDTKTQLWMLEHGSHGSAGYIPAVRGELINGEQVRQKIDSYEKRISKSFLPPILQTNTMATTQHPANNSRPHPSRVKATSKGVFLITLGFVFIAAAIITGLCLYDRYCKNKQIQTQPPEGDENGDPDTEGGPSGQGDHLLASHGEEERQNIINMELLVLKKLPSPQEA